MAGFFEEAMVANFRLAACSLSGMILVMGFLFAGRYFAKAVGIEWGLSSGDESKYVAAGGVVMGMAYLIRLLFAGY